MIGALAIVFLQLSGAPAASDGEQVTVIPPGQMACDYDRRSRTYSCMTAQNEQVVCRRERIVGSRFRNMVCFTPEEAQQIERDSRDALTNQQRISTPQ